MFLLLTRPLADSLKTKSILKKDGHKIYIEPMFKIKYLPVNLLQNFDIILSTSSNSIRALSKILKERNHLIITVGNSTMEVARELGFTNVISAEGNVSSLISYVKKHCLKDAKLLYARGKEISCDLKTVLTNEGFIVEEIILYESISRSKLTKKCQNLLSQNLINGILFFSAKTAKIFCSLIAKNYLLGNITAYSMSKKIAENLSTCNWQSIVISDQPTQESLITVINKTSI